MPLPSALTAALRPDTPAALIVSETSWRLFAPLRSIDWGPAAVTTLSESPTRSPEEAGTAATAAVPAVDAPKVMPLVPEIVIGSAPAAFAVIEMPEPDTAAV